MIFMGIDLLCAIRCYSHPLSKYAISNIYIVKCRCQSTLNESFWWPFKIENIFFNVVIYCVCVCFFCSHQTGLWAKHIFHRFCFFLFTILSICFSSTLTQSTCRGRETKKAVLTMQEISTLQTIMLSSRADNSERTKRRKNKLGTKFN